MNDSGGKDSGSFQGKSEAEGLKSSAEANNNAQPAASSQRDTSEKLPLPAKITIVRSSKSMTDLPSLTPPGTNLAAASAPGGRATGSGPTSAPTAAPTSAQASPPGPSDPSGTSNAPGTPGASAMAASAPSPAPSQALPPVLSGSPEDQEVTALSQAIQPEPQSSKSRTSSSGTALLNIHPSISQHNIRPIDLPNALPNDLPLEKRSDTKFTFPAPDHPMPPPQAPPQFLGDQGHTRPSDASLDKSQFGTASKHGGAPIALLTNVNRHKRSAMAVVQPAFTFARANVIVCALTLSVVLLLALLLLNKDPKAENVANLDLSILTAGQNLEEVNHLINQKQYESALQLCDTVIQKDTRFAEAYHSRGQVYMAMHRFREAVDDFTTAESYNHRSIDIHIDRAAALYHVQDYDKAKREYDQILLTEPGNAAAHFGRGLAEESLGMTDEALAEFKRTLALQADYAAADEEMGSIHFAKGDLKKAYDDYSSAIKIAPTIPRFYFNRANALKEDHQTKRAIADYCKAIQLDPTRPEFFNNRGLLYLENNEAAKAMSDFSSAVDIDPNYTIAKHNLALAQERMRR